jgi:hypothetical protein
MIRRMEYIKKCKKIVNTFKKKCLKRAINQTKVDLEKTQYKSKYKALK